MASSHRKPRSAGKRIAGSPGLGEVERKIDDLYRRAESATEKYTAAGERAARPRKRVDDHLDDVTERAQRPNSAREWLGSFAAAQYRTGVSAPDASGFRLADIPPDYFEQTQLMNRLAMRRRNAGEAYATGQPTAGSPGAPGDTRSDLGTAKATVQKKLITARELLTRLTAQEQQQAETAKGTPSDASYATKAAKAIAFARAQVGKPYVWGATGPGSYDCSGLTQAAWKATGVTLPRATTDQADAGTTVPLAEAQPGDLVFFHDDSSHVGVYVGDGMMIHAPKPGAYVREESVHYDGTAVIHSVVRPA